MPTAKYPLRVSFSQYTWAPKSKQLHYLVIYISEYIFNLSQNDPSMLNFLLIYFYLILCFFLNILKNLTTVLLFFKPLKKLFLKNNNCSIFFFWDNFFFNFVTSGTSKNRYFIDKKTDIKN